MMNEEGLCFTVKRYCPECRTELEDFRHMYCMKCGCSLADPLVRIIDYRRIPIVYGPPPAIANVKCAECGAVWTAHRKSFDRDDTKRYCPECGALTIVTNFEEF